MKYKEYYYREKRLLLILLHSPKVRQPADGLQHPRVAPLHPLRPLRHRPPRDRGQGPQGAARQHAQPRLCSLLTGVKASQFGLPSNFHLVS